jgi:hypothetical protein
MTSRARDIADGKFSGDLEADSPTFVVDAENNRVGVGTSSPAAKLDITGSDPGVQVAIRGWPMLSVGSPTALEFGGVNSSQWQTLKYYTAGSERMRIDASGNLLVGTTTNPNSNAFLGMRVDGDLKWGRATQATSTAGINIEVMFNSSGTIVGTINSTTTATSYNTSSDYRLKEDVQPMVGSVGRLMALKPVNFAWKEDGSRVDGFLAHEAQEVVPECVTGEKDQVQIVEIKDEDGNVTGTEERPVHQGIDQSKIVPLLVAALQEALTKIAELKADVAALKGA